MPEKTSSKTTTEKSKTSSKTTSKVATKKEEVSKDTESKKVSEGKKEEFEGEFIPALGRRKKSVAQVRLYSQGKGKLRVNGKKLDEYFSEDGIYKINQPLKLTSYQKKLDFSILVKGGGSQSQAESIRLGISRALFKYDPELLASLRVKGWITRDPRRKERKKPGLKKARRSPQWSKR